MGKPASITPMSEFVVPRSMPTMCDTVLNRVVSERGIYPTGQRSNNPISVYSLISLCETARNA
jgi:hypothetical protein